MNLRRVFQYGLELLCWTDHWCSCLKHWYTGDMLILIDLSILFNSKLSSVSGGIPRLSFRMFCRTHTKRLLSLNSMLCQTRSLRTTFTLFTITLSILHSGFLMLPSVSTHLSRSLPTTTQ